MTKPAVRASATAMNGTAPRHEAEPIRQFKLEARAGWVVEQWPTVDGAVPDNERHAFAVLMLIAGYLDAGIDDPSIRELSAALPAVATSRIVRLVDSLERQGWVRVDRSDEHHGRNRYALVLVNEEGDE